MSSFLAITITGIIWCGIRATAHAFKSHHLNLPLHVQLFFTRDGNAIQEIIAFPLHVQISVCSVSCACNATSSEKLQKNGNILASFPPANFASPPGSWVAIFSACAMVTQ